MDRDELRARLRAHLLSQRRSRTEPIDVYTYKNPSQYVCIKAEIAAGLATTKAAADALGTSLFVDPRVGKQK